MKEPDAIPTAAHVDAINQLFTELELAYHNQFRRAFPDAERLGMAKQLWLHALCDLSPQRLRAGVRRAVRESEFLPSLHTLRAYCHPTAAELGVPANRAMMVGDDIDADIGGAHAAGITSVLVRSGKFRQEDLDRAQTQPDVVLDSIAALPAWMRSRE